jgi:hypothetical protein
MKEREEPPPSPSKALSNIIISRSSTPLSDIARSNKSYSRPIPPEFRPADRNYNPFPPKRIETIVPVPLRSDVSSGDVHTGNDIENKGRNVRFEEHETPILDRLGKSTSLKRDPTSTDMGRHRTQSHPPFPPIRASQPTRTNSCPPEIKRVRGKESVDVILPKATTPPEVGVRPGVMDIDGSGSPPTKRQRVAMKMDQSMENTLLPEFSVLGEVDLRYQCDLY